jgi:thiamine biosynthesis protein ThiS
MQVRINGQFRSLNGPTTIQGLLEDLGYRNHFVAVALNQQCIPTQQFQDKLVKDQDEIEILAPMAGG